MHKELKPVETVALVRNRLYSTYQFYGLVGKGKNPDTVYKTVISQIFLWLKDRFRHFDEVPEQIQTLSDVSNINDSSLQSFHINDGYIIETEYLKEEQIWAFRLTEPDTGTSERAPVPGRIFVTNFALQLINNNVELGCKTLCSQPSSILEDAEVFRPKLVRDLKESLGIYNITELSYEAGNLCDSGVLKKFNTIIGDNKRNMPVLVIERKKTAIDKELVINKNDFLGNITNSKMALCNIPALANNIEENKKTDWIELSNSIAKSLYAFAYVFYNLESKANRFEINYPNGTKEDIFTDEIKNENHVNEFKKMIVDKIRVYPKRNEDYKFGNVVFLQEALALKQKKDLERLKHSENCIEELEKLYMINERLNEEKTREEQKNRDCFSKLNEEKKARKDNEASLHDIIRQAKEKNALLEKEKNNQEIELRKALKQIEVYKAREKRPESCEAFIDWVEKEFEQDIVLLPRAKDEIKKTKDVSIDLMCDGIEVLASAYKQWRKSILTEEEFFCQCKSLCKESFEITHSGEASISKYPREYKVPYSDDFAIEHGGKRILDKHLKSGVNSKHLLRIYFFWDDNIEKVVIGSMPKHLKSV